MHVLPKELSLRSSLAADKEVSALLNRKNALSFLRLPTGIQIKNFNASACRLSALDRQLEFEEQNLNQTPPPS